PCPGLLFSGILLQEAFVKVAESLFARRKPVELINWCDERLKVGRLPELGLSVGENRQHHRILRLLGIAEVKEELAVMLQQVKAFPLYDACPSVFFGQAFLVAGLGKHLQ